VTVTVNPKPVVPNQTATICSGTAFTIAPVDAAPTTIIPSSTTYTWTVAVNNNVTGQSDVNTAQSTISQTLTNNTNVIQTVVYTVTPTSGAAGTCIGSTFTITVTVNPTPVIPNQTAVICSNGSFNTVLTNGTPTAATIIPTGTTYSWSAPTVTGGVTGGLAGVSQSSIFGTLSNPTALVQTATYTVTATSGDAGSCVASTFDVVVTVNALPIVTLGTIVPVNTMDIQFLIPYTTNFTLTNFSLSANNSAALPSFSVINNAAITTSPLVIPLPAANTPGSYNFDLIVTDSNGCISLPTSATLQINLVKVLDKNGQRMVVPANATDRYGAKGSGYGRTAYGQIISAPNVTRIAITEASLITQTSVSVSITIPNVVGGAVTSRGVCWSTSINPTTANSSVTNSSTAGNYTAAITGLTGGTTYYARSFVTNNLGTVYSRQITFITLTAVPTVTTTAISSITATTANSGGTVTATGGAAINAQGVCWGTTSGPTISGNKTINGTTSPFISNITGLTSGTTYYVRAYATNSAGTAYGNELSFTATAPVITTGLKLHYDTSNTSSYPGSGSTITDLSGNGNNGTLVNNSSFNGSVAGGVLSFNGTNQYISTTYIPSNTCTISIWFYNNLNYTDWNRGIFSTFSSSTYNGFYMGTSNIGSYQSSLNIWYNGNTSLNSISSGLAINTWYNITVTSGSGTIKIYLNGILKNTLSGNTTHADVLNIGRTRFDSNYWSGYIGSTMVYNTVLSASDVTTNFNAQKSRFGY
jgi:hypothetical protein